VSARSTRRLIGVLAVGLLAGLALAALGFAQKKMQSTKLGPLLCETSYGGKFVDIPDFPGEKIDRRLLSDIKYIEQRYEIFVTDGYSMDDVHSQNGEHPIGLALDIVPNKAGGGTWNDIDRLAKWAEPRQNQPRYPFRWVGYDGDAGHGRGDHLHLSWSHTETRPGHPATTVYTLRCPSTTVVPPAPTEPKPPKPPSGGGIPTDGDSGGGDRAGGGGNGGGTGGGGSGGIGGKRALAAPVIETDGVGLGE
jgi:uncharacterized membrane protein YgcG